MRAEKTLDCEELRGLHEREASPELDEDFEEELDEAFGGDELAGVALPPVVKSMPIDVPNPKPNIR